MRLNIERWLAFLGALALTACSTTGVQDSTEETKAEPVPPAPFVSEKDLSGLKEEALSAQLMYQVLAAEVLVAKGYPADAYDLIYPLAIKTRNIELVKRAFELSMATYDEENVAGAARLWLEVEPSNPTPWRAAYLMSLRAGKLQQAIDQWDEFRKRSTADLDQDVLSAARRVARAAETEYALPFFEHIVKTYPDVWQGYYGYGFLATHFDKPQEAIPALKKALVLLPDPEREKTEALIYQLLSKAYLQLASPQPGLSGLQPYLKDNPEDWLVQERMARLEVKAEKFSQAEARYRMILKANPDATTSRLSLALLQIEMERFDKARENLEQVAVQPGYESVGYYYLGVLSQEQGLLGEALSFYAMVKQQPYAVDAQLHRAEILFATDGLESALAVLDKIQDDDSATMVKVLRAKAIFYRASQMYDKSIALYNQAIELDKSDIELLLAQSVIFYDLKRYDEYESNLKRVLTLQPDEVEALNALGYYYVEQGIKLEEAEVMLNKALRLAPDSYYVLDSVGWLAYQQKNYRQAEIYLKKALEIKLDEVVVMHLVAALWQSGKTGEAQKLWVKYQAKFSKNTEYQTLIERLRAGEAIR